MDCRRASERLSAYLDGELGAAQAEAVREHLAACPRCIAEFEGLQRLGEVLTSLSGMEARPGFARRVRLAAEGQAAVPRLVVLSRLQPALARAAVLLVTLSGLWSGFAIGQAVSHRAPAGEQLAGSELDLPMDLLSAAPTGSLADVYLTAAGVGQ